MKLTSEQINKLIGPKSGVTNSAAYTQVTFYDLCDAREALLKAMDIMTTLPVCSYVKYNIDKQQLVMRWDQTS